ncbi:hypothetical protein [Streptomyces sp. NPDC058572]
MSSGERAGEVLGVWLFNTRTRRTGLSKEQRQALTELGIDWT